MKTDNFDEAFRRKVESFHPPFEDEEIDRIQGYVNKHIPLGFWQRFGHTFTYTLGSIVIVSLLSTIIYQAYENKNLLSKISDLNNKLEKKQVAITTKTTPESITIEKIDTVFIVKYVTKQVPNNNNIVEYNGVEQASDLTQSTVSIEQNTTQNQNNVKYVAKPKTISSGKTIETLSEPNNANSGATTTPLAVEQINILAKQKPENKQVLETDKNIAANIIAESVTKDSQQKSTVSSSEPSILVSNIAENSAKIESKFVSKSLYISELNRKVYNSNDLKNIADLTNRKFYVPNFTTKPKEHKSFRFPPITMPILKYRVGLGTNADFEQLGTSLLTDILFAKRWSVTSGVNMSLLGFEKFGDEDDFKRKTDRDFRNQHPFNIPIGGSIEDIEEHQFLFRVPIYLNYRYPLRKDYTLLLTTGTDLDIHLKQFTSYSHYDFFYDEKHEGIEEKIPVVPFNNWLFSVGAEKRWKQFSLQLSPYFAFQLKQLSYRNDNFTFGFRLNGFYRLSK